MNLRDKDNRTPSGYAKGLFIMAEDAGVLEQVLKDMSTYHAILEQNPIETSALINLDKESQKQVFQIVAQREGFCDLTIQALEYLADHNEMRILEETLRTFVFIVSASK